MQNKLMFLRGFIHHFINFIKVDKGVSKTLKNIYHGFFKGNKRVYISIIEIESFEAFKIDFIKHIGHLSNVGFEYFEVGLL